MQTTGKAVQPSLVSKKKPKKEWVLFWMILPWFLWTIVMNYVPIAGWAYAFIDFRLGKSVFQSEFVGLDNFRLMFSSISRLPRAFRNTLIPSLLGLATSWLPIAFAILLNELPSVKYRKGVQTLTTIPNFISGVMVFGMVVALFSTDGAVNVWLVRLGVIEKATYSILNDVNRAWTLQLVMGIWKSIGFSAIIYLASIAGIDQELYDAAMVDGANRFRRIWHITVPGVMPTFLVQTILGIGNFLNAGMDYPLIFGSPITTPKLENIGLYSYNLFKNSDYSFGIALGIVQSLIAIILLSLANLLAKKVRGETIL